MDIHNDRVEADCDTKVLTQALADSDFEDALSLHE